MLEEDQVEKSRHFDELASARGGFDWKKSARVQAFRIKGVRGVKTGTNGCLPGRKVKGKIAAVRRGLTEDQDAIELSNPAMQAVCCITVCAFHTDDYCGGIAKQKPPLVSRLIVEKSSKQLASFFYTLTELIQVITRACGYFHVTGFNADGLTAWKRKTADLSNVRYGGAA